MRQERRIRQSFKIYANVADVEYSGRRRRPMRRGVLGKATLISSISPTSLNAGPSMHLRTWRAAAGHAVVSESQCRAASRGRRAAWGNKANYVAMLKN